MINVEQLYYKIKLLLSEFDEIMKLDSEYMNIFLKECIESLNLEKNDFSGENNNQKFNEFGEKELEKIEHNFYSTQLYRKLAKKLHPDKNKNNNKTDDFIKMSKAFEENDYITLFLLSYENDIKIEIKEYEYNLINSNLEKKENEIIEIKNKIHWKWIFAENEIEKEHIRQHIINNH